MKLSYREKVTFLHTRIWETAMFLEFLFPLERSTSKGLEDVDLEGEGGGPSAEIWGYSSLHGGPLT